MSNDSAFDKKLAPESTMDKVEGLLEHFNLPPKVIEFIRYHQRLIQIALAVIVILVVAWSLYGSYVEKITEEGATALALAMKKSGEEKTNALQGVVDNFSRSSSAMWAKIELGHHDMQTGDFESAASRYGKIIVDLKEDNAMYPLVLYGLAQAFEGARKYDESYKRYDQLKQITGYQHIGFSGMARIEEAQNNNDKAIAIYNNFLLAVAEDGSFSEAKAEVDKQIARLKAKN